MKSIREKISKFLKSEDGPTAVEYAVMVALIIVVAIGAIQVLGKASCQTFDTTGKALNTVNTPS